LTNALAYFIGASGTNKKVFVTLAPLLLSLLQLRVFFFKDITYSSQNLDQAVKNETLTIKGAQQQKISMEMN
jgi:hypothetical protein